MADFVCLSTRRVSRARKASTCIWCGQGIMVGDPAVRRSSITYGDFVVDDFHPECHGAMNSENDPEGFEPYEWARGRTDQRTDLPPEFGTDGRLKP